MKFLRVNRPAFFAHPVMLSRLVFSGVVEVLQRRAGGRGYPPFVGGLALLATLSMSVPVVPLLSAAVLIDARRWRAVVLSAAVGSSVAALLLYLVFHHLGWAQVVEHLPELTRSPRWIEVTQWTEQYGLWTLLAVAASPLPQTPALVFVAVARMSPSAVFFAILVGKLVKYGVVGFLVARFPGSLVNQVDMRGTQGVSRATRS